MVLSFVQGEGASDLPCVAAAVPVLLWGGGADSSWDACSWVSVLRESSRRGFVVVESDHFSGPDYLRRSHEFQSGERRKGHLPRGHRPEAARRQGDIRPVDLGQGDGPRQGQ